MTPATKIAVIDASVAVKWHLRDEDEVEEASELLRRIAAGELTALAPAHIRYEVCSVITRASKDERRAISRAEAGEEIRDFLRVRMRLADNDALILRAYAVAHEVGCVLYDALYVALAEMTQATLITADRALYRLTRHLPYVTWLGDFEKSTS